MVGLGCPVSGTVEASNERSEATRSNTELSGSLCYLNVFGVSRVTEVVIVVLAAMSVTSVKFFFHRVQVGTVVSKCLRVAGDDRMS